MYMYMHIPLISSGSSSVSDLLGGANVGGTDDNNNSLHFCLNDCLSACLRLIGLGHVYAPTGLS